MFTATKNGIQEEKHRSPIGGNVRKQDLSHQALGEDDELIEGKRPITNRIFSLGQNYGQCIRFNERDCQEVPEEPYGCDRYEFDWMEIKLSECRWNPRANHIDDRI